MSNISPLLQRTHAQPLTLELLAEKVPVVKTGYAANQEILALPKNHVPADEEERNQIALWKQQVRAGKNAQETLIISALPLIKDLASKEFSRRKAWSSRISYEEVLQEAISGFIRGLMSYKPAKTKYSATNYLGQWVVTTIRRKLEVMEHDFFIPYEIVDRNRRIVAVRSRLANELQRDPTTEELLAALNDNTQNMNTKWGKRSDDNDSNDEPVKRFVFTEEHLETSRQLSTKLYTMQSNEPVDSDEENMYERSSSTLSAAEPVSVATIDENSVMNSKREFFLKVFISMKIGSKQKDIILRFFGMTPYVEAQNYREIVAETGLSSRYVKNVVMSFTQYMPQKGGIFHYELLRMNEDMISDLELEWLVPILGDWPKDQRLPVPPPNVLVTSK